MWIILIAAYFFKNPSIYPSRITTKNSDLEAALKKKKLAKNTQERPNTHVGIYPYEIVIEGSMNVAS